MKTIEAVVPEDTHAVQLPTTEKSSETKSKEPTMIPEQKLGVASDIE